MEIVRINSTTGMRLKVLRGTEIRGHDKIYDPWLQIPIKEVHIQAERMTARWHQQPEDVIRDINAGGSNHINRVFFDKIWSSIDDKDEFAKYIMKAVTPKVNVLFIQFYAHRLNEQKRFEECYWHLDKSIQIAKNLPHPSWDKWTVSGHFFQARYHPLDEDKAKYCISTILDARTLDFSPHLKYWKIFKSAAWLVGHKVTTPEALKAIKRYKSLNFAGYIEYRGGGKDEYSTQGVLENRNKCLALMTESTAHHLGNP
jgi:hypothetical protein